MARKEPDKGSAIVKKKEVPEGVNPDDYKSVRSWVDGMLHRRGLCPIGVAWAGCKVHTLDIDIGKKHIRFSEEHSEEIDVPSFFADILAGESCQTVRVRGQDRVMCFDLSGRITYNEQF